MTDVKYEQDVVADVADIAADLERRRDQIAAGARSAAVDRHPTELRDLAGALQQLERTLERRAAEPGQSAVDDTSLRAAIRDAGAAQMQQLERLQAVELRVADGIQRTLDAVAGRQSQELAERASDPARAPAQLDDRHVDERTEALTWAEGRLEQLRSHADAVRGELSARRRGFERALASEGPDVDLVRAIGVQEDRLRALDQDATALIGEVNRRAAAAENALTTFELAEVRARMEETLGPDCGLSDAALQRVANEAMELVVRWDSNGPSDDVVKATVARAQGQLAEELLAIEAKAEVAARNSVAQDARERVFIASDRIRDGSGRKLTDGIIAYRDDADMLVVEKAFEVKAGTEAAARRLTREIEALTVGGLAETRSHARDLARDDVYGAQRDTESVEEYSARQTRQLSADGAAVDSAESLERTRALRESTETRFAELMSSRVQAEDGQVRRTIERLDTSDRIYIDGRPVALAVERRVAEVEKVLPSDVLMKDQEARRLDAKRDELRQAASAIVEELRRRKR